MNNSTPSRDSDQFALRLPDGMRDAIKASAAENKRSMNAEIVVALERYFVFKGIDIFNEPLGAGATKNVMDDADQVSKGVRAARRLLAKLEQAEELAEAAKRKA